jgi:hypothetical protein
MCGRNITSTAIAAQLRFNQELCFSACSALVTFTAISARLRRSRFHGNVRKEHNQHGNRCAIALHSGVFFSLKVTIQSYKTE